MKYRPLDPTDKVIQIESHRHGGYTITHEYPSQWEIQIWEDEPRPTIHIFPSLKAAKAWIDNDCED